MIGSGHYVEGDGGIGTAGSGHAIATGNGGMAGSGGMSTMSDSMVITLYGIGAGGSGH